MLNLQEGTITYMYENDDFGSYLVIKPGSEKLIDYQVGMVTNNRIPGLLPMDLRCKNNEDNLYYNITSKITLTKLLSRRKINKRQILDLLTQITQTMLTGIDYLLYNKCYILKQEFIYVDPAEFKLYMVYVPVVAVEDVNQNLRKLIIDLIINATYSEDDDSGDGFIQKIINYIKGDTFNIAGLDMLLKQLNQDSCHNNRRGEDDIASEYYLHNGICDDEIHGNIIFDNEVFDEQIIDGMNVFNISKNSKQEIKPGLQAFRNNPMNSLKDDPYKSHNLKLIAVGIAVQIVLITLFILSRNFLETLGGNVKTTYAAAMLIIVAIDALVIKNLMCWKKPEQKQKIENIKDKKDSVKRSNNLRKNNKKETIENRITDDMLGNVTNIESDEAEEDIEEHDLSELIISSAMTRNDMEFDSTISSNTPSKPDFEYSNKTVVLSPQKELKPHIINMNGCAKEEIPIDKNEFLIGRLEDMVDYVINNNAVGKVHAQITIRNNKYYLKDLNSTNGTMVNDIKLVCNEENEIKDGDRITFANCDYLFVLR